MSKQIVKITLELDKKTHADLGTVAKNEGRSKRKQAAQFVTEQVRRVREQTREREPAPA